MRMYLLCYTVHVSHAATEHTGILVVPAHVADRAPLALVEYLRVTRQRPVVCGAFRVSYSVPNI